MAILNYIWLIVFLSVAVWIGPSLVGGVITTLALRREKIFLDLQDVIGYAGKWMVSCFLGGLVTFAVIAVLSGFVPQGASGVLPSVVEYFSFGVGSAVMGARGAKIILSILEIS